MSVTPCRLTCSTRHGVFVLVLMLLQLPNICALAATLQVPGDFPSIQLALDAAADGDSVLVAPGTYTGADNRNLQISGKSLILVGAGGSAATVIDCENQSRALSWVMAGDEGFAIEGFTLRNGAGVSNGAGLHLTGGSPVLSDLRVEDGQSSSTGAGIWCRDAVDMFMNDITIVNCHSEWAVGGLYIKDAVGGLVDGLSIQGCGATGMSGGLGVFDSDGLLLRNLDIRDCVSGSDGGGIYYRSSTLTIEQAVVHGNSAPNGGGVHSDFSTTVLRNMTITGNQGDGLWGLHGEHITLENSIVAFNVGYGIVHNYNNFIPISCTDIYGNTLGAVSGGMSDPTGSDGNIAMAPLFCDLAGGDLQLASNSPCLPPLNACGELMGALGEGCPTQAAILHVPGDYADIQSAVAASANGDTILLAPGIHTGSGFRNVDLSGRFLTIRGDGPPESVVIDCQGLGRAFMSNNGILVSRAEIESLSIVNGDASGASDPRGGAIFGDNTEFRLHALRIEGCRSDGDGGGIALSYDQASQLTDVHVRDCEAEGDGGGIYLRRGTGTVLDGCLIQGNRATGQAAGIWIEYYAHPVLYRTSLLQNAGSAVVVDIQSSAHLHECIVAFQTGMEPALEITSPAWLLQVSCSDVYANAGGDYGPVLGDQSGQNGNISLNPRFCDLGGGDFQLAANSPCLPAGNGCGVRMGAFGEGCDAQELYFIAGRVREDGIGLPGVRMTGGSFEVDTDASGDYWLEESPGWSGTITPVRGGYEFDPPQRDYVDLAHNEGVQDYVASRSGRPLHVPGDFPTIQVALDFAVDGDSILVAAGLYSGEGFGGLDFQGKAVSLIGKSGAEQTILEWDSSTPGWSAIEFSGEGPGTLVEGFTLRGFQVFYEGGAIRCDAGASPTLRNLIFLDNHGSVGYPNDASGGGLYCGGGSSPRLEFCEFRSNAASYGAAAYIAGGSPEFLDCLFEDNDAHYGGAVSCGGGSPRFERCRLIGNTANRVWEDDVVFSAGAGGAVIASNSCGAIFLDCLFQDNVAEHSYEVPPYYTDNLPGRGGAIYSTGSHLRIEGCTFAGNSAIPNSVSEAGILHFSGTGTDEVLSSIVSTSPYGAGIFLGAGATPPLASCNDVWNNAAGNYLGLSDQTGSNGNIAEAPQFCDEAGRDFTLGNLSPCLPANNECGVLMGAFGEGCISTAAETASAPRKLGLGVPHPNPFNPRTAIDFELPRATRTWLEVFDLSGRRVARLLSAMELPAGTHSVSWNGRSEAGQALPSGVYFIRLRTDAGLAQRKVTLLK